MTYHLIMAVWGQAYLELMLEAAIPSLLSAGNLPALQQAKGSLFRIYTRLQEARTLENHPVIQALAQVIELDIVLMDHLDVQNSTRYAPMNACHRHAIAQASQVGAGLVFLTPDSVYSDGSLAHMDQLAQAGKRAVLIGPYRLNRSAMLPLLKEKYRPGNQPVATIPPRELVKISLDRLHPFARANYWDGPDYNRLCSHCYWPVEGQGIVVRGWHLHPLLVRPVCKEAMPEKTFDSDYLVKACPEFSDMAVVTDSDHITCLELCPMDDPALLKEIQLMGTQRLMDAQRQMGRQDDLSLKALAMANWARHHADEHHRRFFKIKILYHTGDWDARWATVTTQSDRIVEQIFYWMSMSQDQAYEMVFGQPLVAPQPV